MGLLIDLLNLALSLFLFFGILAVTLLCLSLAILRVPYVPTRTRACKDIVKALNITDSSVVYDLGSGNGKVVFACAEAHPTARIIGIEYHFFPSFLARRRWKKIGKPQNVSLIRGDIFLHDIKDATHVYTYLLVPMMDALLPKLERELKPGTRLIAADFGFTNRKPVEVIDLSPKQEEWRNREWVRKLYVYEF